MATQQFDELNQRREFIEKWYSVMNIPEKDKKNRVDVALDYAEIMLLLFYMVTDQIKINQPELEVMFRERLVVIAERELKTKNVAYINDWADETSKRIVEETVRNYEEVIEKEDKNYLNFDKYNVEIPAEEYWTSPFRATLLGIETASTVVNYKELVDAINEGKTRKTWITEGDDKVRKTHDAVQGVDLPINEMFLVGNSYLMMPGDTLNGAELNEVLNCRCHLVFH